MIRFVVIAMLLLAGCQDNTGISAQKKNAASPDKTSYAIYTELMDKILSSKITSVGNGSSSRPGQINPYRKGIPGYQHKALAACLKWDDDKGTVKHEFWQTMGSRSWNYAAFYALDYCDRYKLQHDLNCKCQLLDHDDVNVLEVPNDFRRAYEQHSAKNVAPSAAAPEQQYFLEVAWEKLLRNKEVFPVMVKQVGRVGYVKSASLIGGKKCDAVFRYEETGQGDWEVTCVDGTKAVGVLQTMKNGKGSKGSGFDTDGNKIEFRITSDVPGTKT